MRPIYIGLIVAALTAPPAAAIAKKKKTSAKVQTVRKTSAKTAKASAKPGVAKASKTKVGPVRKRRWSRAVYRTPNVSATVRAQMVAEVHEEIDQSANMPIENAAALVPFFEQLYRHQRGEMEGPLRIIHYGDSHTAADEWTGDLRVRFQSKFGDGGGGYSYAGHPWNGYRRLDLRSGATRGWKSEGLVGHPGDGVYGLGGVSISTAAPRESIYLQADCEQLELFYLQQPGGGTIQLYDNGNPVDRISTDGTIGPGYYRYGTAPGPHRFEIETVLRAPVRLFGWVTENAKGVTYEPLGINGAQASIMMQWDEQTLASNLARRNPALIVLAYGTNEAGNRDLSGYESMFSALLRRIRQASPTSSILVVGPPDRCIRAARGKVVPMDKIDQVVEAQRRAALSNNCAFLDLREKMGGKGSMQQWVLAGMAQADYVHFTSPGYKLIGDAMFRDIMNQYDVFRKVREQFAGGAVAGGGVNSQN